MSEPALSAAVYFGGAVLLTGLVALIVGPRRLGIPTHRRARLIAIAGLALVGAALRWPANTYETRVPALRVEFSSDRNTAPMLDLWRDYDGYYDPTAGRGRWLNLASPVWQFHQKHETFVKARPSAVYRAIRETTADEIWFFQTLTAIRRFDQSGPQSILNAPGDQPILDVATRTGFWLLADRPDREIVIGAVVMAGPRTRLPTTAGEFRVLNGPGVARATIDFRLDDLGTGSRLSTETRVYATDPASAQRFAVYWRIICPGSSIIRYSWLRAIRLRAERAASSP